MRIVITGGHHSSALPVIAKLREEYPQTQLYWIGHRRSLKGDVNDTLEYQEIKALGIPFYDLKAGKVYRTYDLARLLRVPFGYFQAFSWLIKIKPDAILSFGGYLAVPVVIAGWFLGIPSITHEQTVAAGYANKVISHFVKKILISWKESEKYYPSGKIIFSGLPIRESIFSVKSNNFYSSNGLPTIYFTAGKTGSHTINEVIRESLEGLLKICNVIHQCGDNSKFNDFEKLASTYGKIKNSVPGKYYLRKFILENEIGEALNTATIVVSRSGAHTVAELLLLKKPCLLIPIPWSSHQEQQKNAELVRKTGLAEIIEENYFNSEILLEKIKTFFENPKLLSVKETETFPNINDRAAEIIAHEIINIAQKV